MSVFEEMMNDEFLSKFFKGLARMLGEDFQKRASTMTTDELYEYAEFFPAYNPEKHDYTAKPTGYTCRNEDGTIMILVASSSIANGGSLASGSINGVRGSTIKATEPIWCYRWSTDPFKAKAFISSSMSPYNTGECCFLNGKVYRSLSDTNTTSPEDAPASWEEVPDIVLS